MVRAEGRSGDAGDGWPGPFGALLRRDRDLGRPGAYVPRPRRLSKLTLMLAGLRSVRVRPITDSDAPEAGDGPLPVAGGTAGASATFPRVSASVSRRSGHLVARATWFEA